MFFTYLHNYAIVDPQSIWIQSVYHHVNWQFISGGLICKLLTQLNYVSDYTGLTS